MLNNNSKQILSIKNGIKKFSQDLILESIQMDLREGDFISILGASGSGKSTLLKLLAGLEPWSSGEQTQDPNISRAFVFQDPNLLSWRTVLENTLLPLELKSNLLSDPSQMASRGREALKMVHLESAAHQYPHELSGGMKMRTSLARAFITKPRLLFMDEPFAALDEPTRENLQEQLRHIWETQQTTIVFVTHSLQEALFLSNRIIFLKNRPASIEENWVIPLPSKRTAATRISKDYFNALTELRELSRSTSLKGDD